MRSLELVIVSALNSLGGNTHPKRHGCETAKQIHVSIKAVVASAYFKIETHFASIKQKGKYTMMYDLSRAERPAPCHPERKARPSA
jgi:hypothetical protein